MQGFMIALLTCSVTMSVLALLYMAVTPLLTRRYSEKGCYYAWLIIVIGLVIPFRPQWNNAIVRVDVAGETAMSVIRIWDGTPVTIPASNAALPALSGISWWQIAAAVWFVGAVVFLAYHLIKHYRFVKMVKRWSENVANKPTFILLQSLKSEMGIAEKIDIYQCSSIGSPMMIGLANPRILLPKADFAQDELSFVLKHELVHYKRKDLYYKALLLIATAIHWFNPIVCLIARAIDIQCELSCDAETVRSTDADTRQFYSETIIGVIRYRSTLKTALSTSFYGGKKGMKKRISSIMDTGKKRVGVAVICAALLLTIGTGAAFAIQAINEPSPNAINDIPQVNLNPGENERDIPMGSIDEQGGILIEDDIAIYVIGRKAVHMTIYGYNAWVAAGENSEDVYDFAERVIYTPIGKGLEDRMYMVIDEYKAWAAAGENDADVYNFAVPFDEAN